MEEMAGAPWLTPGEKWLNDNHINLYLRLLQERNKNLVQAMPSLYCVDVFFVYRLTKYGYDSTNSGQIEEKLLNHDLIIFPLNEDQRHWTQIIVDTQQNTISYYNPMYSCNNEALNTIQAFLERVDTVAREWKQFPNVQGPRQSNCFDCGVFLLAYSKKIASRSAPDFNQNMMQQLRYQMTLEILKNKILFS